MENSIRQQRKKQREGKKDKFGFSMSLSRAQRRAMRRLMYAQCYIGRTGVFRIEAGGSQIKDNAGSSDHLLYAGGRMKSH